MLQDSPRKIRSLAVIGASIFMIYVYGQSQTKIGKKNRPRSGQMVMTLFISGIYWYLRIEKKKFRYLSYTQEM